MRNRARFAGHAVHPMLVVFPLGLLAIAVVFDIVGMATQQPIWGLVAYWDMLAGLVGGALSAVFGIIDLLGIPSGTRAARVGLAHALLNTVVMALFAGSFAIRTLDPNALPSTIAFILGVAGLVLALVSGWLGSELIEQLGISVNEGANVNAASSLRRDQR